MGSRQIAFEDVVVRLSEKERDILKILVAAMKVSEYTDDVDALRSYGREAKMQKAMSEVLTTVVGLSLVANELPPECKEAFSAKSKLTVSTFRPLLAQTFEVARRFKMLNPDKMRSEYGKLVMLLQDSVSASMRSFVGSELLVAPITTVGSVLRKVGAEGLLAETSLLAAATDALPPRSPPEASRAKEAAIATLIERYGGGGSGGSDAPPDAATQERREIIERAIRSIDDAKIFVAMNTAPLTKLMTWIDTYFRDDSVSGRSLRIVNGSNGSCLTHSHEMHRKYVLEALTLWRIIQRDIFQFWSCVEKDMIQGNGSYRICDTGQGFHRVSSAPTTYARMMQAIREAETAMGGWVGSQIVHLGDRDVPNPLIFIDKYTIIPRLTGPIVSTIEAIDAAFAPGQPEPYPGFRKLLLGRCANADDLKVRILGDFFRHGFDGSGDDGGSCIDGRLTSAWNWCSLLHKKDFHQAFLLTGFNGFDANYS